jgi:hypothetical protein
MATIDVDCEVIIDNQPYFLRPNTYIMRQPRIRQATIRADGSEGYVDLGPGKREWSMTILCVNDLVKYDSSSTGLSGQQYRDALRSSYTSSTGTTINFVDPLNSAAIPVHFDSFSETILDLHSQIISAATGGSPAATYEVTITLVEA